MAIISEENNDLGQKEINRFADLLAKFLSIKENILNIHKQNNDLETEQSKVSALMKFKHKLADDKGQSICVASPWNIQVGQDSTKNKIDFNSKHTDQISQKGKTFEKYSIKAFNVIENKHCESFSICRNNFTTQNMESPRVSLIFNNVHQIFMLNLLLV